MTNLTVIRGDNLTLALDFTDADTSSVLDISGYKIYFTIKRDTSVTDAAADFQESYTIVSGSSGDMSIYMTPYQTSLMNDKYFYDVEVIDRTGTVSTPIYGSITFIPDSTRSIT